jgi:hypothetical protein
MAIVAETLMQANEFRDKFGLRENKTWNEKASDVLLIRENGVTLEFTTMNGSAVIKQADLVLMTFPLGYSDNYTDQEGLNDLDYVSSTETLFHGIDEERLMHFSF